MSLSQALNQFAQNLGRYPRLRALCHVERVVDSPLPRHVKAR